MGWRGDAAQGWQGSEGQIEISSLKTSRRTKICRLRICSFSSPPSPSSSPSLLPLSPPLSPPVASTPLLYRVQAAHCCSLGSLGPCHVASRHPCFVLVLVLVLVLGVFLRNVCLRCGNFGPGHVFIVADADAIYCRAFSDSVSQRSPRLLPDVSSSVSRRRRCLAVLGRTRRGQDARCCRQEEVKKNQRRF